MTANIHRLSVLGDPGQRLRRNVAREWVVKYRRCGFECYLLAAWILVLSMARTTQVSRQDRAPISTRSNVASAEVTTAKFFFPDSGRRQKGDDVGKWARRQPGRRCTKISLRPTGGSSQRPTANRDWQSQRVGAGGSEGTVRSSDTDRRSVRQTIVGVLVIRKEEEDVPSAAAAATDDGKRSKNHNPTERTNEQKRRGMDVTALVL